MSKTIGFFGDSFCAEATNGHSLWFGYKSYMKLLAEHYDAKIVNVGKGGSSLYDTILVQLNPFIKNNTVPDICVFVWTDPGRLFNRKIRWMNYSSTSTYKTNPKCLFDRDVWEAGKQFYKHLYDYEKEVLEHTALLNHIDREILKQLPDETTIVHLWSYGTVHWGDFKPSHVTYPIQWSRGSEIRPALGSVSLYDTDYNILSVDKRCNHLDGQFKNELVFNWIKLAIDNPNSFSDYSAIVDIFYDISPEEDPPAT